MLSYFPARDVEEPVTKEFLRAELAEFREEIRAELGPLRSELAELRSEFHRDLRRQQQWMLGVMVALFSVSTTILALIR